MKKCTKKCQKVHFGNPDHKSLESGKKYTCGEENIKKGAKKYQKVHLGNPDPKIIESCKIFTFDYENIKKVTKSVKNCTLEILTPKS